MSEIQPPAPRPCESCPYRKDVPGQVWDQEEYQKLPAYDRETGSQPPQVFLCHQQNGRVCGGWAACHGARSAGEHSRDLLSLRMAEAFGHMSPETVEATRDYVSPVPLWSSGTEAFVQGMTPHSPEKAEAMREKLFRRKLAQVEQKTGRQISDVEAAIEAMNKDLNTIRENLGRDETEEG